MALTSTEIAEAIVSKWPNATPDKVIAMLDEVRTIFDQKLRERNDAINTKVKQGYDWTVGDLWNYHNDPEHCDVTVAFSSKA